MTNKQMRTIDKLVDKIMEDMMSDDSLCIIREALYGYYGNIVDFINVTKSYQRTKKKKGGE